MSTGGGHHCRREIVASVLRRVDDAPVAASQRCDLGVGKREAAAQTVFHLQERVSPVEPSTPHACPGGRRWLMFSLALAVAGLSSPSPHRLNLPTSRSPIGCGSGCGHPGDEKLSTGCERICGYVFGPPHIHTLHTLWINLCTTSTTGPDVRKARPFSVRIPYFPPVFD